MKMLKSRRLSEDRNLTLVLNGGLRLAKAGTEPYPAPVLSTGPTIVTVQQALMDIGYPMPTLGADGTFGAETGTAVVEFKKNWNLSPRDPVIGPKTIDALDREMVAFERPLTQPPPSAALPPVDPFGRTAAGAAKIPAAVATFARLSGTSAPVKVWSHLDRLTVAAGILERVNNPDGVQQGGSGLCTTAALINVWAQDAPDSYAAFASTLFLTGAANLAPNQSGGGLRIEPSRKLLDADYSAIMIKMAAMNYPVPNQADWMIMSAIRDSSNYIAHYTGDRDDYISHTVGDGSIIFGELENWLRNAGAWTSVVGREHEILGDSLEEARLLDPMLSRCLLTVDVEMLQEGRHGLHSVVLRSPITQTPDGFVTFKLWSWAGLHDIRVTKQRFEDAYFGANVAFL